MKKAFAALVLLGAFLFIAGCSGHQPRHYESRYAGNENLPFANLAYCRFVSGGAYGPSFYICPKNSIYTAGKANNCSWVSEPSHRDGGYNQCFDNVMPSSKELVAARSGEDYIETLTEVEEEVLAKMHVKASSLNVRSAPRSGRIVKTLKAGDTAEVREISQGWARISANTKQPAEWVSQDYLCLRLGCWVDAIPKQAAPKQAAPRSQGTSSRRSYYGGSCPCDGYANCYGPRGGSYCITSGGNKRYR